LDAGATKQAVVGHLEKAGKPFIEVGMGVVRGDAGLTGLVRVVTSTQDSRDRARAHMSFSEGEVEDEYSTNIQIVELNALSAALAVIRFKKLFGFYADSANDYYEGYSIRSGDLVKETAA
jgi:ribosomal 30S subunit maturation factor RimM